MVKGKRIGKYEMTKTLGYGSFAKVKLGIDDQGNKFAVKIINKEQLREEKLEDRLKQEINISKMLDHPHIVRMFDVMQTPNNFYLVLELVTGGELFDRIVSAKRFDENTARKYFQQMVMALYYCHKLGVAHRDLKPENLLVDEKGNIKITDFGLATIQSKSMLRTVCGSPNYVAPEVLKEKGYNGTIADVWSCGIILFVMLSGYLPFDDQNMDALFDKIQRCEYRMPRAFSEGVKDLISKMLTVDPSKRLTMAEIIKHSWFQKNFDGSPYEDYTGKSAPVANLTNNAKDAQSTLKCRDETEKEGEVIAEVPPNNLFLGAFELINMLSLMSIGSMTTNRPVIKIFTRFITNLNLKYTVNSIVNLLKELQANPKTRNDNEIKGFINNPKGLLTYLVEVVSLIDPNMCMVSVRRGRGDTFDFHALYRAIIIKLEKNVISEELISGEALPFSPQKKEK